MFLIFALAAATAEPDIDPSGIDVVDAIECRLAAPTYNSFIDALFGDAALAAKRGWRKVETANVFMAEYDLPAPITVAGHYTTRRIALTSEGLTAELDADPAVVAGEAHITNAMDSKALVDALVASGRVTRAQAEAAIVFHKFHGEKLILDRHDKPEPGEDFGLYTRIILTIDNLPDYPGKAFYGCSYHIAPTGKDGKPW